MATLFFSYSHADEGLRDQLEKQLSMLKRQGVIETWHDRRIGAGAEIDKSISDHVENDDIILLLVSPDFLASDYCYDKEMQRAMQRHEGGSAVVIPVILRACEWHGAPFGKLLATPTDGRPVTQWPDQDQAFLEVAKKIRGEAESINARKPKGRDAARDVTTGFLAGDTPLASVAAGPRSSNLRLTKQFTERDRDGFRHETFEYLAKFFKNSLEELGKRNAGIEGVFRSIDANRFTANIYQNGKSVSRCTVFMGSSSYRDAGIAYVNQETTENNSYNESLSVDADDQTMFLRSTGMAFMRQNGEGKLSQEGAAEFYWSMLIEPLQQRQR